MYTQKIVAQLFTVRDFCRSEEDIARSMEKIAKIGYTAVQISGLADIPAKNMKKIMDDNGLEIIVTHNSYDALLNHTDELIEKHLIYDCKYAGLGSLPRETFGMTAEGYIKFAAVADEIAGKLAEAGMKFVYHNHNFEFVRFGKKTGLELLYDNSKLVQGEIDTHWVVAGGGDPVYWIDKLNGRMDLVHFKDFTIDLNRERQFAEIGEGNLNWPAIMAACERSKIKWCIVEQDICPVDPFESLEISFKNLVEMGLKK